METLNCPICFIKYDTTEREAVVLPCGHTFCSVCTKSANKKCPSCRGEFTEPQVKKNYIIHALLDELNTKVIIRSQETCVTHKREIDRFCKFCVKLMCSVCHCLHIGSIDAIISDVNLRDEVQNALESYKDMTNIKESLNLRIDGYIELRKHQIEEKQASYLEKLKECGKTDILKINVEKEAKVQKIEEEAREKIQEIETNKLKVIKQAMETAETKIKEIESQTETLIQNLCSQNECLLETIRDASQNLKQKIESLQDLTKLKKVQLNECMTIYKLKEAQRGQLQEFLTLSSSDIESLLEGFKVGEVVNCKDTVGDWLNASIIKIENNTVLIHYTGWPNKWDEWVGINSPRLLKQWKLGNDLQINHRIDVKCQGKWLEAQVIKVNRDFILVRYAKPNQSLTEWIDKASYRITEDGARSQLKNGK